jgi:hypothetical protein
MVTPTLLRGLLLATSEWILQTRHSRPKPYFFESLLNNHSTYDQCDDIAAFGGTRVTSLVGLAFLLVDLREGKQFNEGRLEDIEMGRQSSILAAFQATFDDSRNNTPPSNCPVRSLMHDEDNDGEKTEWQCLPLETSIHEMIS